MNDGTNNKQVNNDVSFARNSDEAQRIVGNLTNVRSQINKYAEGADYKDGQTLKEALEEKKKENKITPAKLLSFLLVIPLLLYAKNKGEQDDIQNKIDEEKKRVKEAINQSIKDGDEQDMINEIKKMSKQQKYNIMKEAMNEYSSKMSDSFKNMSDDELKRIVNNLDGNIQTCQSLDNLNIDITSAQNAKVVAEPVKANANAIMDARVDFTNEFFDNNKDKLASAINGKLKEGKQVDITKEQAGILSIDVSKEDTGLTVPVGGISKPIKCKQNDKGCFTIGTW